MEDDNTWLHSYKLPLSIIQFVPTTLEGIATDKKEQTIVGNYAWCSNIEEGGRITSICPPLTISHYMSSCLVWGTVVTARTGLFPICEDCVRLWYVRDIKVE